MKFDFPEQEVNQSLSSAINSEDREEDFVRFELLSAYLDGEATPSERQQVQYWLDHDPQFKKQYQDLLQLQGSISRLPIPQSEQTSPQLYQQVFQKVDRQSRQRSLILLGGTAVAAIFVAVCSNLSFNNSSPIEKTANNSLPSPEVVHHEPLMVALNAPVVEIPEEAK